MAYSVLKYKYRKTKTKYFLKMITQEIVYINCFFRINMIRLEILSGRNETNLPLLLIFTITKHCKGREKTYLTLFQIKGEQLNSIFNKKKLKVFFSQ